MTETLIQKLEQFKKRHVDFDNIIESSAIHSCIEIVKRHQPSEMLLLNADMPDDEIRLHMGEMTAQEIRTARAAIGWANSVAKGNPPYKWPQKRESGEEMVPKWALDSQIEICNDLRKQLETCTKRLAEKSDYEVMHTPMTYFSRYHPDLKPIPPEVIEEIMKEFRCDECGCSVNYHRNGCTKDKSNSIEVEGSNEG